MESSDHNLEPAAAELLAVLSSAGDREVPAVELASRTGIAAGTSRENRRRKVRLAVDALRRAGHRVCAGNDGYWLAREPGEWSAYLEAVRSGARFRFVAAKRTASAAIDRVSGQGVLFGS